MPLGNDVHEYAGTHARYDHVRGTMIEVSDSITNFVTNLGKENRDKGIAASFGEMRISKQELTAIYKQGGIGGKIVDCVAEDLGRVWRIPSLEDGDVKPLKEFQKTLNLRRAIVDQVRWSRLYGSAIILLIVEGDNLEDELIPESISPSKPLSGLRVEHRQDINTGDVDDITGRPKYYEISRTHEKFHPSRVVGPMDGIPMPVEEMRRNGGWGESVLGRCYNSLVAEATSAASLNHLLTEAKVDVVSIKDLPQYFNGGARQQEFERRWMLANQMKGLLNLLLIDDGTETFNTSSNAVTIAGIGPLMQQLANRISAEVDIPMTRLYGQLASGINTSGATNQQDYYDMLSSQREQYIEPELGILDELSMRSVYGSVKDGYSYKWKPFRELSVPEQADVDQKDSATTKTYIDAGVIVPGHAAKRLKENGTYPIGEDFVNFLEKRDGIDKTNGEGEETPPTLGEPEGGESDARIMLEIAEAVKSGKIESVQAEVILRQSFPDMDEPLIKQLVSVEVEKPEPPPMAPGQPQVQPPEPPTPEEEE